MRARPFFSFLPDELILQAFSNQYFSKKPTSICGTQHFYLCLVSFLLAPQGALYIMLCHLKEIQGVLFIGPRCPWGPINGSGCLS